MNLSFRLTVNSNESERCAAVRPRLQRRNRGRAYRERRIVLFTLFNQVRSVVQDHSCFIRFSLYSWTGNSDRRVPSFMNLLPCKERNILFFFLPCILFRFRFSSGEEDVDRAFPCLVPVSVKDPERATDLYQARYAIIHWGWSRSDVRNRSSSLSLFIHRMNESFTGLN